MEQITVGNIHFFFFAFFLFSSFLSSGLFVFLSIEGLVSSAPAFSMAEASFAESASYNALIGGINAQCSSESTVYYFTQDEPFKDSSGAELKEPDPHEQTGVIFL